MAEVAEVRLDLYLDAVDAAIKRLLAAAAPDNKARHMAAQLRAHSDAVLRAACKAWETTGEAWIEPGVRRI